MAVRMEIAYEGDLRCAVVHGPSGDTIRTDAPTDNRGRGERFSPTDLVGAALGSCILTIMGIIAQDRGVDIAGARAVVVKEMTTVPRRRIAKLILEVRLPAWIDRETQAALEDSASTCPVRASLSPQTEVEIRFAYS
ncbi:MAG: OsmC family protein [Planctomycetes bacterium]|nr:OsmC family protein [Planctomycetota bacterium]